MRLHSWFNALHEKYWVIVLAFLAPFNFCQGAGFKDGPHVGYVTGDDITDENIGFGWQITYAFNDYISTELSISRQTDELESTGILDAAFDEEVNLDIMTLALSLRLGVPWSFFTFYAGGGVSYLHFNEDSEKIRVRVAGNTDALPGDVIGLDLSADVEEGFAGHVAGGIEIQRAEHWELFAEYRYVFLRPI